MYVMLPGRFGVEIPAQVVAAASSRLKPLFRPEVSGTDHPL